MAHDQLLDHEYDGIQEYDNPCPGWWHAIFWLTVFFSVVYFFSSRSAATAGRWPSAWNIGHGRGHESSGSASMGELKNDTATILKYKDDADWMLYANSVFLTNCQSCHGADGSGVVGPNLTDDYYKNVKKITDIAEVIKNGAAGGSMPAWETRLHPNEVVLMAAYVAGLRGKNLKGRPAGRREDRSALADGAGGGKP